MPRTLPTRRAGYALTLLAATALLSGAGARGAAAAPPSHAGFAPDHVLVRFHRGAADEHAMAASHGAEIRGTIPGIGVHLVTVPHGLDAEEFADELADDPDVEFAEVDAVVAPDGTPNDPSYASQWHLQKIACPTAWSTTTGDASVVIAVLDSGVDGSHPDLASKMVAGWNFYDDNSDTHDVYGHGTAVAGTAAAATDNGTGVAGVAWNASIMPIRVTDTSGYGASSLMASGLVWAADHGARVANMSFNVTQFSTIRSAAQYFQDAGGVVTISSGNGAYASTGADNPYALTVGATTSTDALASWSNTGTDLDLVAPGDSITTTNRGGGYGSWTGTSFSAPIVAGVAALVLSANPSLSGADAMNVVRSAVVDLGAAGWDASYGTGRVDASKAVAAALSLPAPTPDPEPAPTPPPPPAADTTAPSISIVSPTAGTKVGVSVTVSVAASDDVGVVRVELYVDGRLTSTSTSAPFSTKWNTKKAAAGAHTLQCKAYDAAGNVGATTTVGVTR